MELVAIKGVGITQRAQISARTTHPRYMAVAKTRTGSNIIPNCCAGPRRKPVLLDTQTELRRFNALNPVN